MALHPISLEYPPDSLRFPSYILPAEKQEGAGGGITIQEPDCPHTGGGGDIRGEKYNRGKYARTFCAQYF